MFMFLSLLKFVAFLSAAVLTLARSIPDDFESFGYHEKKSTLFEDAEAEFLNIKDQIVKQFFAEYDQAQLAATKTLSLTASQGIPINFTGQSVETGSINQTTVLFARPKIVTLDPKTKVDVSYEFYQYKQISNYDLAFKLDPASTIKHPAVNSESVVIFTTSPLIDFLLKHIEFVKNMKFAPGGIELVANEGGAALRYFPAIETVTNFGIDVVFGDPEPINPETTTTETPDTTITEEPGTTTEPPTEPIDPNETTTTETPDTR